MDKKPTVSLIMPVYNAEKYLEKALDSVLKQTFQNFEIICINDGSLDDSLKILKKYSEKDNRIIVYTQENKGISSSRNLGLEKASGQYIMFMDSDDFLHYQFMELAIKSIEKSQADICQFNWQSVGLDEEIKDIFYNKIEDIKVFENPLPKYLNKKFDKSVLIWDKIYKADLAKKISFRNVQPGEDDLYTFETMAYSNSMAFISYKLIYHLRNPLSIMHSTSYDKYYKIRLKVVDECFNIIKNLCTFYKSNQKIQKLLKDYYAERFLFKEYIAKPLRKKIKDINLAENVKFVDKQLNDYYMPLKPRFRLVLWLLKKGYDKLARIVLG